MTDLMADWPASSRVVFVTIKGPSEGKLLISQPTRPQTQAQTFLGCLVSDLVYDAVWTASEDYLQSDMV